MSIKSRKLFAILVITMMVLSLLPMTAFAASTNSVDKVVQVSSGAKFTPTSAPKLKIEEKTDNEFGTPEVFRLRLENAKFLAGFQAAVVTANAAGGVTANKLSDTLYEIRMGGTDSANKEMFIFPLVTEITGDGEAKVIVEGLDSAISSTTHVFANAASGATVASISKVNSVARRGTIGDIIIDETRIGAIKDGKQNIKIKLPSKFSWDYSKLSVSPGGGFVALADTPSVSGKTLIVDFTPSPGVSARAIRGSIVLSGLEIVADRDAPTGEVVADIGGTNITSQELVIANYQNYSVEASIKEVKEIVAGRHNNKTAKIKIEENLVGAMIPDRDIMIVLPDWVKVVSTKSGESTNAVATWAEASVLDGNKGTLQIESNQSICYITADPDPARTGKTKYEFELELSVEADKTGDIVAEISGAGAEEQELLIATVVAPITAEVAASDLKIGVQNQPAPDIIITETKKGMIDDSLIAYWEYTGSNVVPPAVLPVPSFSSTNKDFALTVSLPKNHDFASTPTVEVTEGNLEIGKPSTSGSVLTIPIKSSSLDHRLLKFLMSK